jgi:hypothetical protein
MSVLCPLEFTCKSFLGAFVTSLILLRDRVFFGVDSDLPLGLDHSLSRISGTIEDKGRLFIEFFLSLKTIEKREASSSPRDMSLVLRQQSG